MVKQDVVWELARNFVDTGYKDLPAEAAAAAKKCVLDTIGVIEAASGMTPGVKGIIDFAVEAGGKAESTILGFGHKVPAWMAAFANGAMVHCLDYDDIHHYAKGHPSANVVPPALATAERLGKVSGKELITAVALGIDLYCRISYSVDFRKPWMPTPMIGVFTAAATAGKLIGLDQEKMVDAMGLAFCQAAGTQEIRYGVGSDIGGMRDAFSNNTGVLSAFLAQKGMRGVRTCFEGKAGFYNVYYDGKYDRKVLLEDIGEKFCGSNVSFKPWPACGGTHSYIDATLALVNEHGIKPEDVEAATVYVGGHGVNLCQPIEGRRHPATSMDAKFSIPFATAVAIAHGKVTIDDYSAKGLKDPVVLGIADKVTPVFDEQYAAGRGFKPARVEVKLKNGQTVSKRTDHPYGHPDHPLTWDDIIAKFRDCVAHAAKPVRKANVEKIIMKATTLEDSPNAADLVGLLFK